MIFPAIPSPQYEERLEITATDGAESEQLRYPRGDCNLSSRRAARPRLFTFSLSTLCTREATSSTAAHRGKNEGRKAAPPPAALISLPTRRRLACPALWEDAEFPGTPSDAPTRRSLDSWRTGERTSLLHLRPPRRATPRWRTKRRHPVGGEKRTRRRLTRYGHAIVEQPLQADTGEVVTADFCNVVILTGESLLAEEL